MKSTKKASSVLMTEGAIWKHLLWFSMPLLLGNLFQQLYNTVDSIVVGNYIGSQALAAVGSSNSLINLIIGMFLGTATGAGVIISQYYGAGNREKLSWAVHTCMTLSVIGGAALIVLGILVSPVILRWMGTPEDVMDSSVVYFRIFFSGSLFNLVYNMGAGILRAVGDSKRPLYYLCVASVINTVLDMVFVVVFHMGIAGVGYATVIAQGVSSLLVMRALMTTDDIYKLELSKMKIDKRMMKRILAIGIPSGIQHSIVALSNVIVQANINAYGSAAMAGYGAYTKVDSFLMLPLQSFCIAATTFTGQNIGAEKWERVKKGIVQGLAISGIYTMAVTPLLYLYGDKILGIFSPDAEVIRYGLVTMSLMLPFYFTLVVHQILMGTFRGAGKTMVSMMIGVGNMCVLRMIYIKLLVPYFPSYEAVLWCYPVTWITTMLMDIAYCFKGKWLPEKIISEGK